MHFIALLAALPLTIAAPASPLLRTLARALGDEPTLTADGDAEIIPGKFIVMMKPSSNIQTVSAAGILGNVQPDHTYQYGEVNGFAAGLSDDQVTKLNNHEDVLYIEPDVRLRINALVTQRDATWGISRISHKTGTGGNTYVYDSSAGNGTCAYVVDTGTTPSHPDFGGRAVIGKVFDNADGVDTDQNGHGTHVSGTIGSNTYGVAKKTKIIGVKVCDKGGYCTLSNVIAGIMYAIDDRASRGCAKGSVLNMSLGATNSEWRSLKTTVQTATNAGIFVAVAAGNSAADASGYSPASAPSACTVGATDNSDAIAYFSNFGSTVDVFAPGDGITSTWNNGQTEVLSGTSMASPHIAGLGAYLLTLEGARTPVALCERIRNLSTKNVITGSLGGASNDLAFNGATT